MNNSLRRKFDIGIDAILKSKKKQREMQILYLQKKIKELNWYDTESCIFKTGSGENIDLPIVAKVILGNIYTIFDTNTGEQLYSSKIDNKEIQLYRSVFEKVKDYFIDFDEGNIILHKDYFYEYFNIENWNDFIKSYLNASSNFDLLKQLDMTIPEKVDIDDSLLFSLFVRCFILENLLLQNFSSLKFNQKEFEEFKEFFNEFLKELQNFKDNILETDVIKFNEKDFSIKLVTKYKEDIINKIKNFNNNILKKFVIKINPVSNIITFIYNNERGMSSILDLSRYCSKYILNSPDKTLQLIAATDCLSNKDSGIQVQKILFEENVPYYLKVFLTAADLLCNVEVKDNIKIFDIKENSKELINIIDCLHDVQFLTREIFILINNKLKEQNKEIQKD